MRDDYKACIVMNDTVNVTLELHCCRFYMCIICDSCWLASLFLNCLCLIAIVIIYVVPVVATGLCGHPQCWIKCGKHHSLV